MSIDSPTRFRAQRMASSQRVAAGMRRKKQRGGKIRGRPGFRWPGIAFDSGLPTTFASTPELRLRQRDVRFQARTIDELAGGSLKRSPWRIYIASNADRASLAFVPSRSTVVTFRGSPARLATAAFTFAA